jgi:hypothetical protein
LHLDTEGLENFDLSEHDAYSGANVFWKRRILVHA